MSLKIFAKNLKYLRAKADLSKKELAEALRIKETRLAAWEEARAFPRAQQLIDLCNALEYYNVYVMLTLDVSKSVNREKRQVPAAICAKVKEIKRLSDEILNA